MWTLTFAFLSFLVALSNGIPAQECGGTVREHGVFLWPNPFDISNDFTGKHMECIWHIEAPESKKVVFKISEYALKRAYTCTHDKDHIAVFDGNNTDEVNRLAFLCSKGRDLVIPSTGNTLTIKLKTASFNDNIGFVSYIVFTYNESVGCGGNINLEPHSSYNLKSPEVTNYKEGDSFECLWNFAAPEGQSIKISFSSFNNFSCKYNHVLEVKDGNVPDSLLLGTFCGENIPPVIVSSSNRLTVRMSSNEQSTFTATVTVKNAVCIQPLKYVHYASPSYRTESVDRGINCGYEFRSMSSSYPVRLTIKNLEIKPNTKAGKCDTDKIVVGMRSNTKSLGRFYKVNNKGLHYLTSMSKLRSVYDDDDVLMAQQFEICGMKSAEFYFPGTFYFNLITAPGTASKNYKGFEIEVLFTKFCGRNYTEPYGRVISGPSGRLDDCYTLISAPVGFTISIYFISFQPDVINDIASIDFYDGKTTESNKIVTTQSNDSITVNNIQAPIFSTGNYILIKNRKTDTSRTSFDLNYIITNKGRGCGGYYYGDQGVVTSPLYPETYQEINSCEWELETPVSTRVRMIFDEFDLSGDCETNYVKLIDREGNVLSRYCTGKPNKFTSIDNYIKIVFVTDANNKGRGWHAMFGAIYTV